MTKKQAENLRFTLRSAQKAKEVFYGTEDDIVEAAEVYLEAQDEADAAVEVAKNGK